jgi:holdfast attachment protein HfaA
MTKSRPVPDRHGFSAKRGMAVALKRGELDWNIVMRLSKPLLLAVLAAASISGAARAGDWTNSANYNGYGNTTQNTPSNFSLRDTNGNLTLVNGQFVGSNYSTSTGVGAANAQGGVGMFGAPTTSGQATAIGNSLNVMVLGNHNTTVVDTTQINNGNQTATAALNSH